MTPLPKVIALAGDPGGGAALAPVLNKLQQQAVELVSVYGYRESLKLFRDRGIACEAICESISDEAFRQLLIELQPDAVILATSINGVDLERKLVRQTNKLKIPSLSVLDFWSNYRSRYMSPDEETEELPSRIAVMDSRSRDSMVALGFSPEIIQVTGQPALDHLNQVLPSEKRERRTAVRRNLEINESTKLIVFMSQPVRDLYENHVTDVPAFPYDEKTVFDDLLESINSGPLASRCRIVIKPHPRESEGSWEEVLDRHREIMVETNIHSHDMALAADCVVGMASMVLVECAILGCKVVSMQPQISPSKNLFAEFPDIERCYTVEGLSAALLSSGASNVENVDRSMPAINATDEVIRTLRELILDRATA